MKILAGLGFVVAVALTFIYMSSKPSTGENDRAEWKRNAVEQETSNRPSSYEAMKWSPDEKRMPASK